MAPMRDPSSGPTDRILPRDILRLAITVGVTAGLVHVAAIFLRREMLDAFSWSGQDALWMAPLAYPLLLTIPAIPLALLAGLGRRQAWGRAGMFLLAWVAAFAMLLHATMVHPWALLVLAAGLAARFSSAVAARPLVWRGRLSRSCAIVVMAGILVGAGSVLARTIRERRLMATVPEARDGAPNVLVLILDTVRAASLGLYGYSRPTTPNIEQFAAGGAVFDRAMAPSPWTLPSHASLFTGRWPGELSTRWQVPLDRADQTLAERFHGEGYATGGFAANIWYTSHESGLGRGFVRYKAYRRTLKQVIWSATLTQIRVVREVLQHHRLPSRILDPAAWRWLPSEQAWDRKWAPEVTDEFLEWQGTLEGRPFFAFLNYFDAHDPYWPPEPYRHRFSATPTARDLYDASIALIDDDLGRLFGELNQRGALDNTIVIIASDHGEQFGEHGLTSHGNSLYLPVLHVPLVIRYPARVPDGLRIVDPVSLRDLGATILELAGLEAEGWPGRSFAGMLPGTGVAQGAMPLLAEVEASPDKPRPGPIEPTMRGPMKAVFLDRWHYIQNGDGVEELYDIVADPGEAHNLAARDDATPWLRALRAQARIYP